MIIKEECFLDSADGMAKLHVVNWEPYDIKIKGVIQIVHGIAEYAERYDKFARYLCSCGYAVAAHDNRGHGETLTEDEKELYFGDNESWWHVTEDIETVRKYVKEIYADVPYFIFGHSMGSYLLRSYMASFPCEIDGCILCGTGFPVKAEIHAAKAIIAIEKSRVGRENYSSVADKLIFGTYNMKFRPNKTSADWISANPHNVEVYMGDPLCGGKPTTGILDELMRGVSFDTKIKNIKRMNSDVPVLLISGKDDPVGSMGKGVRRTYRAFRRAGIENVQMKLYPGLRHEILNEKEKDKVYTDITGWIEEISAL